MSKIPRLPGDGAQMEDTATGDLPPSLRASTTSILSNWRKKQQAMVAGRVGGGGGVTKQTPLRVQSVRIVEAKRAYGPKRRTESCSIFGNSNFGKRGRRLAGSGGSNQKLDSQWEATLGGGWGNVYGF